MTWDEEPSTKEMPRSGADTEFARDEAWPEANSPQAMAHPKMAHPNQRTTLVRDINFSSAVKY
jgi:hypothetical protein